jgi:hypothetical protein
LYLNNLFKLLFRNLYFTEHKDILIREYLKRLEMADETNADYENTIHQFRELVANLQRYYLIKIFFLFMIF